LRSALVGFAIKMHRLHRRVVKLEQAVVSSVMEDDDPAKQIQADTVLKIYERILHSERYSNSTFAMKEARRLCRLKE
jgi:hypothetical protein